MLRYIMIKIKFSIEVIGIPQLVIEVLSPSNSDDDLIVKKDLYEEYVVVEYWIVSPMSKKIWIY